MKNGAVLDVKNITLANGEYIDIVIDITK